MPEFKITPQASSKVTGLAPLASDSQGSLSAILKVAREGYVPEGITLRQRIDGTMFTANVPSETLPSLEDDESVISVAISEPMAVID